ncbi:MAG: Abi family protein [Paludibacteraceae bacterium]|nr:Abi family protein [Paludibacteraceae bacterium]
MYSKPPISIDDQITLLKGRGLSIPNEEYAHTILEHISYYRFASYLRPMETDKSTHKLYPDATFDKVLSLYHFDASLRLLVFNAIQEIEISLRSRMIQEFSMKYGAFWFFDESHFVDKHRFVESINVLDKELLRSKDEFIKEHIAKYGKLEFPPSWKTLELTSFGTLSKLFANFSDNKLKKEIARSYGIPQHEIFESWTASIVPLRNCCAHHGRLWNKKFPITPLLPSRMRSAWISDVSIPNNKLYAILCCVMYLLNAIDANNSFAKDVTNLITTNPYINISAMGFPSKWRNETLWHS